MSIDMVKSWRRLWTKHRDAFGDCLFCDERFDAFTARLKMRLVARKYAEYRGWTVKLTPPQRSHR